VTLATQDEPGTPVPPRGSDPRDGAIRAAERATYASYGLGATERYVRVDAGCGRVDVRITEFGNDESQVPVVMLHGIGSATVLGASLVPHLRDRRVIALDWPGHGLSGACVLPATLGIRTHATTAITSLLDALGLEQVDLVGHSLGAQFALYAAHDLGSRIRRIVLLGAPGAAILGVKPVTVMKLLATPGLGRALLSAPMSLRAFHRNQDLTLGPGALDDAPPKLVEAAYLLAGRTANAASIASFFRALIKRGVVRQGVGLTLEELGRVHQPALLVWGDQDVFLVPSRAATSIVALRDMRLLRLPTAGHAPWLQADPLAGRAIAQHLSHPGGELRRGRE
jgi:pimeloyl-ACP methyl ester carboxylesterase